MSKICTGIDIGSSALKMAVCDNTGIRELYTEPMPENIMRGGVIDSPSALSAFIRSTARSHGIHSRRCAFVLPQSDCACITRRITVPYMTPAQIELNLPYEFRDYTRRQSEYTFDYAVVRKIAENADNPGGQLDILATAAPTSAVENYRDILKHGGFTMVGALPRELALASLLRGADAEHGTNCIIEIGHSSTGIFIYSGSTFETMHTVDIGAGEFDRAIAEELSLDRYAAREYKHLNRENVLNGTACTEISRTIAFSAARTLGYYCRVRGQNMPQSMYICGGGAAAEPISAVLAEALLLHARGKDVQVRHIAEIMPQCRAGGENMLSCAAAAGAALM